jgi:hypothetical protein
MLLLIASPFYSPFRTEALWRIISRKVRTGCAWRPLSLIWQLVKSWMDDNPNDGKETLCRFSAGADVGLAVVTLLIVNIDNQPPSAFDAVFKSAGVDSISYAPPANSVAASDWPTLGSMIDSGKRLVTFLDNQADITVVPYLLDGML